MNGKYFEFTKKNVGGFFHTPTNALPSKQAGLVKVLGTDGLHAAEAVLEAGTPPEIAGPIIYGMIGTYQTNVAFVINGWTGNA